MTKKRRAGSAGTATKPKQSAPTIPDLPMIIAVRRDGSRVPLQADWLEFEFGEHGRLSVALSGDGAGIEVIAETASGEPELGVLPGAANAVVLRLQGAASAGEPAVDVNAPVREPLLNLFIQKALDDEHKRAAPRKHQIRRWAQAAMLSGVAEVTIRLVGEAEGRRLNREYRGKDYATNVLTFVYDDAVMPDALTGVLAGDLVICVPVVLREATSQGKTPDAHFAHLVVHGMLHLQGHDHEEEADAVVMEQLEREILAALGHADPYA